MLNSRSRCLEYRWRSALRGLCAAAALLLLPGCAGWTSSGKAIPDVKPEKAKRGKETAKLIREQRDRGELQAAQFAWQQGDTAGARELLERVLKRDPQHHEAGLLMAELLIVEQQPDEARRQLEQLVSRQPNDPRVLHAIGSLLEAEDKPQEALSYFRRASRLAPDNQEYRISCQTVGQRLPARLADGSPTKQPAMPAKMSNGSLNAPRHADVELAVAADQDKTPAAESPKAEAALVSARGESDAAGVTAAEAATPPTVRPAADLSDAEQLVEQGGAALAAGKKQEAQDYFRRARRAAPNDPKIPIAAAVLAIKRDDLELAVEIVQEGLRAFPSSSGLYRLLGVAQYRQGDFSAARNSFEQSLSLDKSNPLAYFLMGSTLKKLGQTEAAERHFRQARQLDPRYAARR